MVAFVRVGFTIFAALLAAAPVAADFDKPELTAEQKEQVRAALKAFGTAGGNLEKQQQAVDDAIAAGPHAAGPLVKRVDSRFRSELKKYQKSAHKAAARLGDKRLVTAADEMLADNPRLQKSRKSLEELAAMHVALQSAAGTDGATSGAAAAT
ncbi:MAG TPA: hypothetical protein VMX74_08220, partial [Pirellulales bacterium]|nr:hypothetical protein [Pirellulales bacterium]